MTSSVTLTDAIQNAQRTENQAGKLAEDFDQFLNLLTTQLKNQDPLDPMDSTEFTNQIVQFTQVEQSINMNKKLDELVGLQLASISSVALGYVGMDVSYRSSEMNFDGANPLKVSYALEEDAVSAKINILDESGELVFTADVASTVGAHSFTWNGEHKGGGTVPEGTYTVRVDAVDADDGVLDSATVVTGRVRGIESQDGVIFMLIGERAVPLSSIINAALPGELI